jgi:hypothetical protein
MSSSLGSRPDIRNSVATLSTSLSMLSRTPGYWILMAMSRPSLAWARCTWPMEAAAMGVYEKMLELLLPARAPLRVEHALHLGFGMARASERSRARISASAGRQQVAGFHRYQLPHLHGRAAQLGELVGHPARVGRREQQVAHLRAIALGELL